MTRDHLNAIRAQYATEPPHHIVIDLLAEVERLRDAHAMAVQVSGELCEKCGWAMKFPEEKCRCELLAEVERLTAERDHFKTQLRESSESLLESRETVERLTLERGATFQRGVAAMREAAVQRVASYRIKVMDPFGNLATVTKVPMPIVVAELRTIPDPEDTP